MKSGKSQLPKLSREFGGCIELIPAPTDYTEFVDSHRIRGFPSRRLTHFRFQESPNVNGQKTLPPDQLVLVYSNAIVILRGWRLELMVPRSFADAWPAFMPSSISAH